MQTKPTNWDNYLAAEHTVDFKIVVDGTTYNRSAIVSLKTSGALYDSFGIGNCCARSMEVEFYPTSAPARQATVKVYCRLESGGNYTEYIQKGTYFISTRQTDHTKGTLKLTCYDAILKADRPFTDVFPSDANFPIAPSTAVSSIATALGVTVDARTSLNSSFLVEYPADEDGDMTLREMLGRIAVANAGNWVITDTNKLRLVPLQSSASPILLGAACASLDKGIVSDAIGKVEVLNNSGKVLQEWVFGSYSGKVMSVTYPDAVPNGGVQTQAANPVAYAIYTALNGYVQYGFKAEACIIDPCVELGDRITVGTTGNTITSTIANEEINFDALYTSDVSAPDADEIEDEYPYQTYQKSVEKKVASAYSKISKTQNDVSIIVQNVGDNGTVTAASIVAAINDAESSVKISADHITVSGFVTFQDLSNSGRSIINGDNITTGTITSNYIKLLQELRLYESSQQASDNFFGSFGFKKITIDGSTYQGWGLHIAPNLPTGNNYGVSIAGKTVASFGSDGNTVIGAGDSQTVMVAGGYFTFNGATVFVISDKREKHDINYNENEKMVSLFDKLKPVTFVYNHEPYHQGQHHLGFIAQDVEQAVNEADLYDSVWSINMKGQHYINYNELIACCVAKIKSLEERIGDS